MIREGFEGSTKNRDEAMQFLINTLYTATDNVYVKFRGIIGAAVLKPTQFRDSSDIR